MLEAAATAGKTNAEQADVPRLFTEGQNVRYRICRYLLKEPGLMSVQTGRGGAASPSSRWRSARIRGRPAWWSAWMCDIHTQRRRRTTSAAPSAPYRLTSWPYEPSPAHSHSIWSAETQQTYGHPLVEFRTKRGAHPYQASTMPVA